MSDAVEQARAGGHPQETTRQAVLSDVPRLAALAADALVEKQAQKGGVVWARHAGRRAPLEDSVRAAVEDPDQEVVVGELDGVAVGYGVARLEMLADGGRLGVVEDIFVTDRARELGLGELLMDRMISWCRAQGCFGVDSVALPGDRATKNFFESFGLVARAIVVHKPL